MDRVEILVEDNSQEGADELGRHWAARQTFAYVSAKQAASAWLAEALERLPVEYQQDHFCLLTSGSTGDPKLVIGRKQRSEKLAGVLHQAQESEPVRETIVTLPLAYCYAFVNQWLWSRVTGRRLVLTPGFAKPDVFRDSLRKADDAMLCLVGSQVSLLQVFGKEAFPGVIRLHFAGGRFPQERIGMLREIFPNATIFNNYGCAEALPRLTLRRAEDADSAADIGRPIPGVELRTSETGDLLFLSEYGCVAQSTLRGFQPVAETEWIPSGDLARAGDNRHWHLLGRAGEVFKRYGEKIAIPQILSTVNDRWQGQVSYYRERDGAGEDGYVLVLSPSPTTESLQQLLQAFRSKHPRTHWPLRIESLAAFPLLHNGKVNALAVQKGENKTLLWRQRI